MKLIKTTLFYIRYGLYNLYKKIFGKKSKKYMITFFGRFPENFKHVIKPVIDYESEIRFTFGPGSLIVIFSSKKGIPELNHLFNKVFSEYVDMYFLYNITNSKSYSKCCLDIINKHLFYPSTTDMSIDEKIDKIQIFIDTVTQMRDDIKIELLRTMRKTDDIDYIELDNKASFSEITEENVNIIIDKITESGFESLTEEERETYNKLFKK